MEQEIWKDIVGYEGVFQVSNLGKVKSLSKTWKCGHGNRQIMSKGEYIKKAHKNKRDGYWRIILSHNDKKELYLLHRLVAEYFIPNPKNKSEVNHKYGNKDDNRESQLEWNTAKENSNHAFVTGLKKGKYGLENSSSKLVLDLQTGIFYDCAKDAAIAKNISYQTVSKKLRGAKFNNLSIIYV
jgi:hypothetical protein